MPLTRAYEAGDELELEILHFDREFEFESPRPQKTRPTGARP